MSVVILGLAELLAALSRADEAIQRGVGEAMEPSLDLLKTEQRRLVPRDRNEIYESIQAKMEQHGGVVIGEVGPGARTGAPPQTWPMETGRAAGRPGPPLAPIRAWALRKGMTAHDAFRIRRAIHRRGWPPPSDSTSPHAGKKPPIYVARAWKNKGKKVTQNFRDVGRAIVAKIVSESAW